MKVMLSKLKHVMIQFKLHNIHISDQAQFAMIDMPLKWHLITMVSLMIAMCIHDYLSCTFAQKPQCKHVHTTLGLLIMSCNHNNYNKSFYSSHMTT
jgi:hypothetical protein